MSTSTVTVFVKSPDTRSERRFDLHTTIGQLKAKLELITGIPVQNQAISLVDSESSGGNVIGELSDDGMALGFYNVRDWQLLNVIDTNPSTSFTGQLTDVSQVDKFELTDAEYAQRQDTVLAYKQRNKVGRFAPKDGPPQPVHPPPKIDIPIGSRCEVESGDKGLKKRGTVRFVGHTKFGTGEGTWVGVEYDEPLGKNNGSVQGEQYFTCRKNYGVFVRPDKLKIGDYPELELDLDDEEM